MAIDDDGRVFVAGQYGVGYNRGGLRFWTAVQGRDGNWITGEAVLSRPGRTPTMAADATVAAGSDGRWILFGLGADSVRYGVPDASLFLARVPSGSGPVRIREVSEPAQGLLRGTDKPWMVRDPGGEGREASLVLGWTELEVDLNQSPVEIRRTLVVGVATEDGRLRHAPVSVAPEALGVQLAVGEGGTVDAVWTDLRDQGAVPSIRIRHARSSDGGRSFQAAGVVAERSPTSGATLGHPTLAAAPSGALMACWPEWEAGEWATSIACAQRVGQHWTGVSPPPAGEGTIGAFPALAWAGGRWWLSYYEASGAHLRMSLVSRATRERDWRDEGVLAEVPDYDGRFCPAPGLPCRDDDAAFFPGDYVSAAGNGSILAVAYVLPDGDDGGDRLVVSVLDLGPAGAAGPDSDPGSL